MIKKEESRERKCRDGTPNNIKMKKGNIKKERNENEKTMKLNEKSLKMHKQK